MGDAFWLVNVVDLNINLSNFFFETKREPRTLTCLAEKLRTRGELML